MSHVKSLIARLEAKIKEQSGSSSTTATSGAPSAASASSSTATTTATANAAPRTVIFTSPEDFAKKQKETEAALKQNSNQAKQMAARYNLTYRTLELKAQKDEEKAVAAAASAGSAPPPPSTRRASLAARRASMVNKPVVGGGATVVAPPRRASMMAKLPGSGGSAATTEAPKAEATKTEAPKEDVSIPNDGFEVYNAVEADAFWMTELALALAYEDEGGINRAILQEFFEEHDPDRLGEIDQLLKEWEGKEDELFAYISLTYMGKQEQANQVVDDSAERAALAVFEQTLQEEEEYEAQLALAIEASKAEDTSASTAAASTGAKPRRTSVINRVVLNQQGGVQAAEISTIPLLDIDVEEKSEEVGNGKSSASASKEAIAPPLPANPYIISGLAQDGQAWQLNSQGEEQNQLLREKMLATGHTEEEVKAVMQNQGGLL